MIRYIKRLYFRFKARQIEADATFYDLHGCKQLAAKTRLRAKRMRARSQ